MSPGELATHFYAIQDASDRSRIIPISALTGDGLELAMSTIVNEANKCRNQVNSQGQYQGKNRVI